ncbi:rhomboid family intramembrane serine protease [Rhodocaloribacter sp.]
MYNTYQPPTRFSVFPPVIKNLLILNGLFFMASLVPTTRELLIDWLALWPLGTPDVVRTAFGIAKVPDFWPWQLITYSFLHGGFGHIFFNMFALWMFGVQIENTWGSRRFAIFYFVCVVGAAISQLIVSWGVPVPTLGASGGVFGILLAFGMMFPNQPIYLYFLFPIKAKWFVIGYGLIELWAGVSGAQPGVANFAHLGGMLFGFLLIQYWRGKLPLKPERPMRW